MNSFIPSRVARLAFRQPARQVLRDPADVSAHFARLHAALALPGSEPVQGALADLYVAFGAGQVALKRSALRLAQDRLAPHVQRWFEAQSGRPPLARITALATRWSVLARPSADISTRGRRCSVDISRALADQVVTSFDDAPAGTSNPLLQEFFHHCVTCEDTLAFMLARRSLLRRGSVLPPDWEAVSQQLEQAKVNA